MNIRNEAILQVLVTLVLDKRPPLTKGGILSLHPHNNIYVGVGLYYK